MTIYDPFSTRPCTPSDNCPSGVTVLRDPLGGNIIPKKYINPVGQAFLKGTIAASPGAYLLYRRVDATAVNAILTANPQDRCYSALWVQPVPQYLQCRRFRIRSANARVAVHCPSESIPRPHADQREHLHGYTLFGSANFDKITYQANLPKQPQPGLRFSF